MYGCRCTVVGVLLQGYSYRCEVAAVHTDIQLKGRVADLTDAYIAATMAYQNAIYISVNYVYYNSMIILRCSNFSLAHIKIYPLTKKSVNLTN